MNILITNDDGIDAPGMAALFYAASPFGQVSVVAPSKVRSACGHAVTFHRPLRVWPHTVTDSEGNEIFQGYAVDGVPADCVKVGTSKLLDPPPDLVISGINAGCNVGIHTLYSGTVAGAREAAIIGIPAISMSLFLKGRENIRWDRATKLARECLEQILSTPLKKGTFLNINLPVLDDGLNPKGLRVVPASNSAMIDEYDGEPDEAGRYELTVGGHVSFGEFTPNTDAKVLFDGYITVTPLTFETTNQEAIPQWKNLEK